MATQGIDRGSENTQRLTIGRYVLDLQRSSLLRDGSEITLRSTTFSVLCYLVQHPDRLVTTDELRAAVWPGLVVTDGVLIQAVDELRRALGDTGARLIVTVEQRGYRFEVAAVPADRRKSRRWQLLRWRWFYGILAPFALLLTLLVLWLVMRDPR